MRHLRAPNVTFDFYILPNVPPAGPDIQQASGYLHTWFFPGMQVNRGKTAYFFDSALDVELKVEADDPFPNIPGPYRVYIPDKMNQGYDVVFIERFRLPPYYGGQGGQDFKRIFLRRRIWSSKPGLITEGGLTLASTSGLSRPVSGAGGLALAGIAACLRAVLASGGVALGNTALVIRHIGTSGGVRLGSSALVLRLIASSGGLRLGDTALILRPYSAAGGFTLGSTASRQGGNSQTFTSSTTWTVPSYFPATGTLTIIAVGSGANGTNGAATHGGPGGGGGGYSLTTIAANPGDTITIKINDSGTCWASNNGVKPTSNTHGALANNGSGSNGGSTTGAIGTTTNPGGNGGTAANAPGGGGGGAGPIHNSGAPGGAASGGPGGTGTYGSGGKGGNTGSNGSNATGNGGGGGGGATSNLGGQGTSGCVIIQW